jgi:hypothetical protein
MYKSYLILISDYILTSRSNLIFDIGIPFIISVVLGYFLSFNEIIIDRSTIENVTTVLGILAGFSVTAITILTSANSENIIQLKSRMLNFSVDGKEISYFRKHYILISYSVLICLIVIIVNTISFLIPWSKHFLPFAIVLLKSVNIFLILHVFFINIRNITSLYFIYFDDTNR